MEIVYGIENFHSEKPTCVTVGTFDGLHIGHRKLLGELCNIARSRDLLSVVVTFDPHPRQILAPGSKVDFVLSRREKIEAFRNVGIDCLVIHAFDREFASKNAKSFLENTLCNKLNMKCLVKGFNNHFGSDRLSDLKSIQAIGNEAGFDAVEVEAQQMNGVKASSSLLRKLIHEGQIADANVILGYNFPLEGDVVHGREIGRKIGFPTANIHIGSKSKIIPNPGVYAAVAVIDNKNYPTMLNIGSNPTVNDDISKLTVEAHVIGFEGNLYGQKLPLRLIKRIRTERKFSSLETLKSQLYADREAVETICRTEFR